MNPDAHTLWRAPQWALAALLALLGMLGPFSIDTYIPAFTGIAQALQATPLEMQQTLSAYLFGFAFMNLFHGGRLAAMPPKLLNDEGDVLVLRPLAFCAEADLGRFAQAMRFPIIPCDLCGSQEGLQRNAMKAMLADIERRMPGRKDTMVRALGNVRPSHLLDPGIFDFAALVRPDAAVR